MGNVLFWLICTVILIAGIFYLHRVGQNPKLEGEAEPHNAYGNSRSNIGMSNIVSLVRRPALADLYALLAFNVISTSFFYVGQLETGHVVKRFMGAGLPQGRIIAVNGETGPQAQIHGPGLKFVPLIRLYADIEILPSVEIPKGHYAVVTALDGRKLPEDVVIASPLPGTSIAPSAAIEGGASVSGMFDAVAFLDPETGGFQGVQATVLKPGIHRLNLYLYNIEVVDGNGNGSRYSRDGIEGIQNVRDTQITQIPTSYVGVVKSNI